MLYPAGVSLRCFRVYTGLNQPFGKETVLFVDLFRHFLAHIGQVEGKVLIHREEAALLQGRHRMAHTGFGDSHVPGHIYRAYHAPLLL